MPESYGPLGVKVPKAKGEQPNGPQALKDFADSFGEEVGKGKLLVAQDEGGSVFKTVKGDATLAEDGALAIAAGAVTDEKLAKPPLEGTVSPEGARVIGERFAVKRIGLGLYKITFEPELMAIPIVHITPIDFFRLHRAFNASKKGVEIALVNHSEEAADSGFQFTARLP